MPELSYLDFDLTIETSPTGYRARVLDAPEGPVEADFALPFSTMKLENLLLRAGQRRGQVRRADSPQVQAAKDLGGPLYEAIFGGAIGACFEQRRNKAAQQSAGLRIRLHFANAPELADVPWEYLYNSKLNRFLALSTDTPVVRYLDLPDTIRSLTVKPPLRVLVMIANPSDSPAPLDVEREWTRLGQALAELRDRGLVEIERLERPTLSDLQQVLRRNEYHIFHFIGHGHFDERAQDGVLSLEDEARSTQDVTGQDLGMHLHNHRWLRLAILNACEGARSSRVDPFAGTAQSLVQQGIPAVIAMQFEISDEAAIAFTHEFYKALADSYPVDAALTEARLAIWRQATDAEWATPVLYLRAPDGRIFDVAPPDQSQPQRLDERKAVADPAVTPIRAALVTTPALPSRGVLASGAAALVALVALLIFLTRSPVEAPAGNVIVSPVATTASLVAATPIATTASLVAATPIAITASLAVTATTSAEQRTTSPPPAAAVPTAAATPGPAAAPPPFAALDVTPIVQATRHDVRLDAPWALAVDRQGNVYVADTSFKRIQKLSAAGEPLTQWGAQGTGPGQFGLPEGVAVDEQGNVYVADAINDDIQKFSPTGQPLAQWGSQGSGPGEFASPIGVAVDGQGNIFVSDFGNNNVQKLSPTGEPLAQWGNQGSQLGQFNAPQGIAVDSQGNIYVADLFNDRIEKLSPTGQPLAQFGSTGSDPGQFKMPYGVAVDGQGNIYVADRGNTRVQKLSPDGKPLAYWGTQGSGRSMPTTPAAVALDGQGNIYVANLFFSRILKLSPTGQLLAVWGG